MINVLFFVFYGILVFVASFWFFLIFSFQIFVFLQQISLSDDFSHILFELQMDFARKNTRILTHPCIRRHYPSLSLTPSRCFPSNREQRARRTRVRRTSESCYTCTWIEGERETDIAQSLNLHS